MKPASSVGEEQRSPRAADIELPLFVFSISHLWLLVPFPLTEFRVSKPFIFKVLRHGEAYLCTVGHAAFCQFVPSRRTDAKCERTSVSRQQALINGKTTSHHKCCGLRMLQHETV